MSDDGLDGKPFTEEALNEYIEKAMKYDPKATKWLYVLEDMSFELDGKRYELKAGWHRAGPDSVLMKGKKPSL
jgi:hypothetical protein